MPEGAPDAVPDFLPVTTVVVIRHGQTTWGALGRYAGWEDVPLTDLGWEQARAVAERVGRLRPAAVVTSPLRRCRDTAEVIADDRIPVVDAPGLVDGRLGEWTGFTVDQIAQQWPDQFSHWRSDAGAAPPGGESFDEIRVRSVAAMTQALVDHAGRTVVLVTHSATTKMLLAHALDVPSAVAYRLRIDNASFSVFTLDTDGAAVVLTINETGHLPV